MMGHWYLRSADWVQHPPAAFYSHLRGKARVAHYLPGERIFVPSQNPEWVYLQEEGHSRIYSLSEQGEEFTLEVVAPGEIFGELAILQGARREHYATALDAGVVLRFAREVFLALMREAPDFALTVTRQVSGRLLRIESRARDLVFRDVPARLAQCLLRLAHDFGEPAPEGGVRIGLRFTQAELATLIGASRPTTNLVLRQMREQGWIRIDRRHLVLMDQAALQGLEMQESAGVSSSASSQANAGVQNGDAEEMQVSAS